MAEQTSTFKCPEPNYDRVPDGFPTCILDEGHGGSHEFGVWSTGNRQIEVDGVSQLDIDLLSAIQRIEQIGREGIGACGGLIVGRLISCDAPRLRCHVSESALAWEAQWTIELTPDEITEVRQMLVERRANKDLLAKLAASESFRALARRGKKLPQVYAKEGE